MPAWRGRSAFNRVIPRWPFCRLQHNVRVEINGARLDEEGFKLSSPSRWRQRVRAELNLLRLVFADPELRRRAPAWRQDAPRLLASFRRDFAVAANDAAWAEFLQELERLSPEFRTWWRRQDADGCAQETLTVDETRHLRLVVYLAQPGEANSAAFEALLGGRRLAGSA